MSTSIDVAFVKQYEAEVKEAYQRRGSQFRQSVRTRTGVVGKTVAFPRTGKGMAGTKARHGKIPTMNVDHFQPEATLQDFYAGDWVDKLDELKTNIDERRVLVNAGAYALGRKTDDIIISALTGATNFTTLATTSSNAFRNSMLDAREALAERDVPWDGEVFGAISPAMMSWLLTVKEFANSDYVGDDLPYKNIMAGLRSWHGVHWWEFTGLGKSGNNRTGFIYSKGAVGHAIGLDVTSDITWHGDRAAWFIANMMSMGTVLVDGEGVQKIVLDESAALPTT